MSVQVSTSPAGRLTAADRQHMEDVGWLTCMSLVLLGNYSQTGHFGGPLAYTPYNVAVHLAGPDLGGLRYDYRRPKHPYSDKFMLAAGHCAPTCYALWMVLGQALARKFEATGDRRYYVDPEVAMLPVDAHRVPSRRRRAEDAPGRPGARRPSALRAGEGTRHSRALGPHRVHRPHE